MQLTNSSRANCSEVNSRLSSHEWQTSKQRRLDDEVCALCFPSTAACGRRFALFGPTDQNGSNQITILDD